MGAKTNLHVTVHLAERETGRRREREIEDVPYEKTSLGQHVASRQLYILKTILRNVGHQ